MPLRNIVNYVALLLQESLHVVWAKDGNSLKQRVDLAELAGSGEILSNCEESVKLYIAFKCCIMPRAKYNYENIPKLVTWGEGTLIDLILKCFVKSLGIMQYGDKYILMLYLKIILSFYLFAII